MHSEKAVWKVKNTPGDPAHVGGWNKRDLVQIFSHSCTTHNRSNTNRYNTVNINSTPLQKTVLK